MLTLEDGTVILVENKIDAAWSVAGDAQPDRYRASVEKLQGQRIRCGSLLLAPELYLSRSRHKHLFDRHVSYEDCLDLFEGEDRELLARAIAQAHSPYEPEPDIASGDFFSAFRAHVATRYPGLVLKREPNGKGVHPTGTHTFYFDVPRTLKPQPALPRPRMSLQAWDSGASSPSVKIMLGGLAHRTDVSVPSSLREVGGYLRPAGKSLGIVIDTPRLDPSRAFLNQISAVDEGLSGANRLKTWWDKNAAELGYAVNGQ